jgi:alpha-L-arabinofuranosidase
MGPSHLGELPAGSGARLVLDPAFRVGPLSRRLFGSFVEHMGRCVYTGIYEPGHDTADEYGFRTDVQDLVTELGPTILRYPGGNFVSNYSWEDGVGPKADRPTKLDFGWRALESNQVGTDDFLSWCSRIGVEAMLAVNLGTRGITEAIELLQYTNGREGTELTNRRVRNGYPEPHNVRVWCLGNEMDGPWQMGFKTPPEYARLAEETARAMKRYDGDLELVACGSSNSAMPTFGSWERIVLDRCFEHVSHISAHAYYEPIDSDVDSFLACAENMHRFISAVVATADHVAATKRSDKLIMVSFDEWNVWYQADFPGETSLDIREPGPLIEDVYDVTDAVVVGSLLITLMQHADRVSIACQAQLVNVIAPIMTRPGGPAWRQTIFHPFALTSRYAKGQVLRTAVVSPSVSTAAYGDVDALLCTATYDPDSGDLVIFAVNRSRTAAIDLSSSLAAFEGARLVEHLLLHDEDSSARNTEADPDRVVPRIGGAELADGTLTAVLPPVSWHCFRLREGTS